MNLGIIIAWIAVSCITITVATLLIRRKMVNEHKKEMGENQIIGAEKGGKQAAAEAEEIAERE